MLSLVEPGPLDLNASLSHAPPAFGAFPSYYQAPNVFSLGK